MSSITKFKVGDKIKVRPGKDHNGMGKDEIGVVSLIGSPALGIKFPSVDGIHKWYTDDEVSKAASAPDTSTP